MPFYWHRDAPELDAAIAADNGPAAVRAAATYGGVGRTDDAGRTPLHRAAEEGARAAVAALADAGAPPGAANPCGWTPAHYAARNGDADTVTALLKAGAAVDPFDIGGSTPLHCAAKYGQVHAAACLLAAGADRGARDDGGKTPAAAWGEYCDEDDPAEGTWEDAVAFSRGGALLVRLLTFGAQDLRDPGQTLEDAGVPQEAVVELGEKPVFGYPPEAVTGPHQLHVQSSSGKSVCVEVARDATVGGVAALAARCLAGTRAAAPARMRG